MITKAEYDILKHTSTNGRYVSNEPLAIDLGARGLMLDHGPQRLAGGAHYLTLTGAGRTALVEYEATLPKPVRRRQSEQFEAWRRFCDACSRISFTAFLRDVWPNRRAW